MPFLHPQLIVTIFDGYFFVVVVVIFFCREMIYDFNFELTSFFLGGIEKVFETFYTGVS